MTKWIIKTTAILFALGSSNLFAAAATISTKTLSFELANKLAVESAQACRAMGYQVSAAVVDRGGNLLAQVRDPLAGTHTLTVSKLKAQTAATFQTSTIDMRKRDALKDIPGVLLIGGGVPVKIGGHFYGAVGISGAPAKKITGDTDDACAHKGIDTIREAVEFGEL